MQVSALTVAGSDPSGGAGIQGDLKTFHAHGVYGLAVITLHTVQSSLGVREVVPVCASLIERQLAALFEDFTPGAAKTGALASASCVEVVARALSRSGIKWVADPVLVPTSGPVFANAEVLLAVRRWVLPLATLITPNASEVEALTGLAPHDEASALCAAEVLCALGARAVLIKGGHFPGEPCDVYRDREGCSQVFHGVRRETVHTHGTGCALSAAITAQLALGLDITDAILAAKTWLGRALDRPLLLGQRGAGPVNHFTRP